jgi:hypothetical protein
MSETSCPTRGIPRVELTSYRDGYIVSAAPKPGVTAPAFEPFPLTFPQSFFNWLLMLGEHAYRLHNRCVAASLVLDTTSHIWFPMIPNQVADSQSVSWTLGAEDVAKLAPAHVIAGSYQTRDNDELEVMAAMVPMLPGLHIVQGFQGNDRSLRFFVRIGEEVKLIDAWSVMFNDWATVLERHSPRMTLR